MILLQKAVQNITLDGCFINRWTHVLSLEKNLKARYQFYNGITITKATI